MSNQSQLVGSVNIASQGIYTESSDQLHSIGAAVHSNDGRVFRYCKVGATSLVPGLLYQAPDEDTTNFQNLTVTAPAAGDTSIVTTSTVTLTANQLAGGFLVIESATTNAGQMMRIKGHLAATTAVVTINLDDPVPYTPTGTVQIDMHPNPYGGVIVMPTTSTSAAVGFALYKVTNAYYGWLCSHGPTAALAQGTVTVGDGVIPAETTTAGAVVSQGNDTHDQEVGYALTGIASTDYGLIFATID